MADHRFVRRHWNGGQVVAENRGQRQVLHLVVFRCRGAVGVDIADAVFGRGLRRPMPPERLLWLVHRRAMIGCGENDRPFLRIP